MTSSEAFEAIGRGLGMALLGAAPVAPAIAPVVPAIDPAVIMRAVDERIAQLADAVPPEPEQLDLLTRGGDDEVPFEPTETDRLVQARYDPNGGEGDPLRWMQV